VAEQRRGGGLALLDRVLHRLEPARAAVGTARDRAVARGDDRRVRRAGAVVDDDAALAREARLGRQRVLRDGAHADQHQPGRVTRAVGGEHRARGAVAHLDLGDLRVEQHLDAVIAVQRRIPVGELRRDRAREQPRQRFEHRHRQPALARRRGDFQPDESAADHDDRQRACEAGVERGRDRARVVARAQREHAARVGPGQRERARARAGGERQARVGDLLAALEAHDAARPVDAGHAHAGAQLDVLAREGLGRTHHQLRGLDLAGEPRLRQRRAVVRAVRLLAEQAHAAGEAAGAQRLGDLHAGLAGPDDDDVRARVLRHRVTPGCPRRARAAPRARARP